MTEKTRDYSKTVLTPRTEFPMRASLAQREPERLARWEAMGLYEKIQEKNADKPTFILHDGPPYANGDIHLGHSLNKILKDIIVRYKSLKGFRSPYVPGWDCHGLPIEQQVLKKLGKEVLEKDRIEVRRECHKYAQKFVDIQREQFKRLGVMGDWERPYTTFDPKFEAGILRALRELVAKGYVVKGMKPVHWDPVFRTALAEAEIEYHTHTSDAIYVKFPLRDADRYESTKGLGNVSIVIWTTTPWTIPANLGVTLHPDFEYVAVKSGEEHWIVAKELLGKFIAAAKLENPEVVRAIDPRQLDRAECDHPIFPDKASLVMLGDHVTLEAGTGAVHTAPGHGADDFMIGKRYGLPVFVPVDDAGRFSSLYPEMEGVGVFDANPKIIEKLRDNNLLVATHKYEHDYPYSWRSHKPIIFRATEQWFMELRETGALQRALEIIDNDVKWIPQWGYDRIRSMVAARPDWCLSRQRSWGVPIPSIRHKDGGESILHPGVLEKFIAVVAEKGTDAWFTEPLSAFWPDDFRDEKSGSTRPEDFEKEWDILDVWFDSGASHIACLEQDERLESPADLYLEGSDQHRGWFQSSLLISVGTRDRAPYRAVLTHGFLLDESGRAMSKSIGNVISPLKVVEQMGADILRLWVSSEDYRNDVRVSDGILKQVSETYRRIRNTLRFLIGNLEDFDPAAHGVDIGELEETDRWALNRLADLVEQVDRAYEAYEFHRVHQLLHTFCNMQLSSVYLDIAKDRLYCSAPDDPTRRKAQTTLRILLETLCGMLAPVLSFTADEAWEYAIKEPQSIHLTDFPSVQPSWRMPEIAEKWRDLIQLRDKVSLALEEARRAKTIGHSLDAELELTPRNAEDADFLTENVALLKELFIVSGVSVAQNGAAEGSERKVRVSASPHPKCERCWMRDPDLGRNPEHPGLCPRCSEVVQRIQLE